ncbi:MAG: beta-lactamase family protein [Oscillospiraceae bacterium]|jgi:CubicO group peptidase (beta-lactamase class C family)|nr:beta-lactamase family protein [Oscillospiraceae bacterium]
MASLSVFVPARVRRVEAFIRNEIECGRCAGAVVLLGEGDNIALRFAAGLRAREPEPEEMTVDTIFDLASITKVFATWPLIVRLLDQGVIDIDDPLSRLFPYPIHQSLEAAALRDILTHSAGFPERTWARQYGGGIENVARGMLLTRAVYPPGREVRYCSRGAILLGHLIELKTGNTFARAVEDWWQSAGFKNVFAGAVPHKMLPFTAPTERRPDGRIVRGETHDENAAWLGGFAGHAGAFADADTLAAFARMVINGGQTADGSARQVLPEEWVRKSLRVQTPPGASRRGLIWNANDLPGSPGEILYDHLGFTGVGLWIEPKLRAYAILLTNYIHPNRLPPLDTIKPLRDAFKALCWAEWGSDN